VLPLRGAFEFEMQFIIGIHCRFRNDLLIKNLLIELSVAIPVRVVTIAGNKKIPAIPASVQWTPCVYDRSDNTTVATKSTCLQSRRRVCNRSDDSVDLSNHSDTKVYVCNHSDDSNHNDTTARFVQIYGYNSNQCLAKS
jgi:hypothetical protein